MASHREAAETPGWLLDELASAGVDIVLHCNGDLAEARAVAEASPELQGASLERAEAALRRAAGGPAAFDVAEGRAALAGFGLG